MTMHGTVSLNGKCQVFIRCASVHLLALSLLSPPLLDANNGLDNFGNEMDRYIASTCIFLNAPLIEVKITTIINEIATAGAMMKNFPQIAVPRVMIVNSPVINAYSGGGRYIFITTGLLNYVTNRSELAGVIAHEFCHSAFHHPLQAAREVRAAKMRGTLFTILMIAMASAPGMATGATMASAIPAQTSAAFQSIVPAEQASIMLEATSFSLVEASSAAASGNNVEQAIFIKTLEGFRDSQELAADTNAVKLLSYTTYDPTSYLLLLKRLSRDAQNGDNQYNSHLLFALPGLTSRIQAVESQIAISKTRE